MAHSSDRTLLASLGFQDPDRRSNTHTLACQYLCEPDVTAKIGKMLWPDVGSRPADLAATTKTKSHGEYPAEDRRSWDLAANNVQMEVSVKKGGGYLIGFWDVGIQFTACCATWDYAGEKSDIAEPVRPKDTWTVPGEPFDSHEDKAYNDALIVYWKDHRQWQLSKYATWAMRDSVRMVGGVLIEVKAGVVDVSDIARQIETYQTGSTFVHAGVKPTVIVATCWPMSSGDRATLAAKGIRHIHLADAFKAYCKRREADDVGGDTL